MSKISATTKPDANIGRRLIDQYVLVEKIGEGGMGSVYLADQPTMGRRAVVKLLHPSLSRDPQVSARFNLEARAAAALNHPHIVTVYNYGALPDGTLFLAMEHLEGCDLERTLQDEGAMTPARAVHVARQICEALGEAHARGVVHRDLKPSNVMRVTRGRDDDFVKVLDFGIAKVRGVALTETGQVFGTPEFMSPEQLRGGELDGRSDLYALGVMLFEMLAGRLPFDGEGPEAFMAANLEKLPPRVTEFAPDVPAELEALVARLLAKDRAARPATAEETAALLEAAVRDAPATAVGGKRSDPPGRWVAAIGESRSAIVGGVIGVLAIVAIVIVLRMRAETTKLVPVPTAVPATAALPSESKSTSRSKSMVGDFGDETVGEIEHEFLTMRSSLSVRDRRAAVRALYARIEAGEGDSDEKMRKKRQALKELIRQHAN